ncbi:MAG: response regulator [Chloroflexi bacterium]|nr:response regulator [Chloroflexota bacterium]
MPRKMDRSKVVIVLEDDQEIKELLASVLQDRGYYVVAVDSGRRALEVLQQVRARLLVLDVMLPDMDGNEVLQAIREDARMQDTKVMILSGHVQLLSQGSIRRVSQLVPKPFDVEKIVYHVEELIGKAEIEAIPIKPLRLLPSRLAFAE